MLLHISQIGPLHSAGSGELAALFVQEYCSVANSFVLFFCGVFAFQMAIYYMKGNEKYIGALRRALVLLAIFSLLLVPASVHHLLGVASGWFMVDVGVGLSYLIQALLIAPTLLMLTQKMRSPQNPKGIKKWACIAAPAYVFALYFKYLLLWLDTLVPMGPKEATLATAVGGVNSVLTLLVAGIVVAAACYLLSRGKQFGVRLAGVGVVLVGCFFLVDSLVAVFVPVYASFWYLTDFWMVSLPVLGAVILLADKRLE
jgi:heme/copper-type cytochrome/quinol oxidase subunit 3